MADLLEIPFKPEGGKMPAGALQRLMDAVSRMDGKRLILTLKEQKRKRSANANAYLWGAVYPAIVKIFREHGNAVDADDIHLFCKANVGKLKQVLVTPDGEVLHATGSTRNLSTAEFSDYIQTVIAWSAETLGISIPSASEWAMHD